MSQTGEADRVPDTSSGAPKAYPYLPPRIHEEKFQASVPSYDGKTTVVASDYAMRAQERHSLENQDVNSLQGYFSSNVEQPQKADARLLEFLDQLDFDIEKAKRLLEVLHSGGKDLMHTNHYFGFLDRHPTAVCFADLREKLNRSGTHSVEFFAPHIGIQELFRKEAAKDRLVLSERTALTTESADEEEKEVAQDASLNVTTSRTQSRAVSSEKIDARNRWLKIIARLEKWHEGKSRGILSDAVSIIEDASQIPMHFAAALQSSAGSSAQAQEDQEHIENLRGLIGDLLKRVLETQKWAADAKDILFRRTFTGLLLEISDGRNLVSLDHLSKLIHETSALPLNPREEEMFLQQTLQRARDTVSYVKRLISPGSLSVSPLLLDCDLDFNNALHTAVHGLDPMAVSVRDARDTCGMGVLWFAPVTRMTAFELEDMLCVSQQLERKPRLIQLSHLAVLPVSSFTDRPVAVFSHSSLFSGKVDMSLSDTLSEVFQSLEKHPLYNIQQSQTVSNNTGSVMLTVSSLQEKLHEQLLLQHIGCRLIETLYLQGILHSALKLEQSVAHVLRVFQLFNQPAKNKTEESRRQKQLLSLSLSLQLAILVVQYPIQLPSGAAFLQYMLKLFNWKTRVNELDTDNTITTNNNNSSNDDQRRSSQRSKKPSSSSSSTSNSNNNINLMEVESLIKQGELWPFQFSDEFSVLQKRKEQALEWIARFKQLFSAKSAFSGSARHRSTVSEDTFVTHQDTSLLEEGEQKATLSELRMLISQGGSLLGDNNGNSNNNANNNSNVMKKQAKTLQKEMDKALSTVEEAEDWIDRFRTLITDFFSQPCFLALSQNMLPLFRQTETEKGENETGFDTVEKTESDESKEVLGEVYLSDWETVQRYEDLINEQRAQLISEIAVFLSEAQQLPIVIEEAQVLNLQLQVLKWAVSVRPLLLRHIHSHIYNNNDVKDKKEMKIQKVKLSEFNQLRQDILIIRKELKGFSNFLEIPNMYEEELFKQCAEEADLLLKRIKQIYSGRELKSKVSVEKVRELLLLSDHSPVDFDNELRVAKNALRHTETWQLQHRQDLLSLGIILETVDPISFNNLNNFNNDDINGKTVIDNPPDGVSTHPQTEQGKEETSTLKKLEQLATSVTHLALDFPTRRSLFQRVEEMRQWQQKAVFAQLLFEKLQETLRHMSHIKDSTNVEEVSNLLSLSELSKHAELLLSIGHNNNSNNNNNSQKNRQNNAKINGNGKDNNNEDGSVSSVSPMGFPLTNTHLQHLLRHAKKLSLSPDSDLCIAVSRLQQLFQQWCHDCKLFLRDSQLAASVATHSRYLIHHLSLHPQIFQVLSLVAKNPESSSHSVESVRLQLSEVVSNEVELSQQLTVMTQAAQTFPFLQGPLPVTVSEPVADDYAESINNDFFKTIKQLQMLEFLRIIQSLSQEMFDSDEEDSNSLHIPDVSDNSNNLNNNNMMDIDPRDTHGTSEGASEDTIQRVLAVVCGILRHLLHVRQVATHVSCWANLDLSYVSQLLRDTSDLLTVSRVMPHGDTAQQLCDTEADMSRWLQTCALTLCCAPRHKRDKHETAATDLEEEKELEQRGSDNVNTNYNTNDCSNDSNDSMEKDEESDALQQPIVYEPKSTRLSQGIVKRKEDSDFADSSKIHLHHPASAIAHININNNSTHYAETQSNNKKNNNNNKRRKSNSIDNNSGFAVKSETMEEDNTVVDEQNSVTNTQQAMLWQERRLDTRLLRHLLGLSKHSDDTEWILLQLCRQGETQQAVRHMCPAVLLVTLPQSLQLWRCILQALTDRLHETHLWQTQLRHITSHKTRDTAHGQRARLATHLSHAVFRGIVCHERNITATQLQEADDWLCRARGMLAHDKNFLLDLDKLKLFVKQGESLLLDAATEVAALKNELKKGRSWKTRCEALLEQDAGSRDQDQLTQLTKDAETLCVDVSVELEAVSVDSRSYCLCRQMYFGDMVGCDLCDDWYHYSCANLSANQVAKCEQYTCVRCNIKASLAVGASVARQICAKWQNAEVHFEDRMNQLYKINRRILRLQDEKEKAKQQQLHLQATMSVDAAATDTYPSNANTNDMQTPSTEIGASVSVPPVQGTKGRGPKTIDLEAVSVELDRMHVERQQLTAQVQLEEEKKTVITAWMADALRLIAPQSEVELQVSRATAQPLTPLNRQWQTTCELSTTSTSTSTSSPVKSHVEAMSVLYAQLTVMLPPAGTALLQRAILSGIHIVDDVQIVIDAFRWMSWCNLGLFLLRFPPPTPLLRRFIAARPAKLCDDKILRHLQVILSKAVAWKSKARKTGGSSRKVDDAKLRAMVLEANNLPFSSRMKSHYQMSLWRFDNKSTVSNNVPMLLYDFVRQFDRAACDSSDDEQEAYNAVVSDNYEGGVGNAVTEEEVSLAGNKRKLHQTRTGPLWSYPDDTDSKLAQAPQIQWPVFGPFGSNAAQNTTSSNVAATQFLQQQQQVASGANATSQP